MYACEWNLGIHIDTITLTLHQTDALPDIILVATLDKMPGIRELEIITHTTLCHLLLVLLFHFL